jgi:pyruvate formate lyase activating enzyme
MKIIGINRHRINTDGKGIRTLIGLGGCSLNCKYCINKDLLQDEFEEISIEELLEEVLIDYCYFVSTNGGVTFGGGEPLLQWNEIIEFIKILPNEITVCIETSLNLDEEIIRDVIEKVDGLIIDIKSIDKDIYKKYTGIDNEKVLNNLELISKLGMQEKCKIRIPKIKKYTTKELEEKTIEYIKSLGYTNIDYFKYEIL